MSVLHLPGFGAGIVREGSSDAQSTAELRLCDAYDIGPRGQLVAGSALAAFSSILPAGPGGTSRIYGLHHMGGLASPVMVAVIATGVGGIEPVTIDESSGAASSVSSAGSDGAAGSIVTFASFPHLSSGAQTGLVLVNIAARRPMSARSGIGLCLLMNTGGGFALAAIGDYDSLGTGSAGEVPGSTDAKQLYFRGIAAYNNHVFGYGFDDGDVANGEGPSRLMFSNTGNPLKWGKDNREDPTVAGAFADSDAIAIGESIRAIYEWQGRLWVGTSKELHWVSGYGRESFLTNGAIGLRKSLNVCGPHAMIEGPDGYLYGVSSAGLWQSDGSSVEHLYRRLVEFDGRSTGYWDLIYANPSGLLGYPGYTNQDLVWMLSDPETMQVWVVIPFCNASAGYGGGSDTVIIKWHCETGGFSRQVLEGVALTAGCVIPREATAPPQRFVAGVSGGSHVHRYGYQVPGGADAPMPAPLPDVEFGEYAPFGPNGAGVIDRLYLTFAWDDAASLPLVFTVTPTIDGQALTANTLTIGATQPVGPSNGDTWVDTSGTDTNLGNGTAGSIVGSNAGDYLVKVWVATWNKWVVKGGGAQGTRMTVPVAITGRRGTRISIRLTCTSAGGRFQVEGLGQKPNPIREDS